MAPTLPVVAGEFCFACLPKGPATKVFREKRQLCVERGYHRPKGDIVPHSCVGSAMRACYDCGSLVVG